jgi:hypothetical protein
MVKKPIDRQRLISDYLDAFRAANPEAKAPIVAWRSPFFLFKKTQKDGWEPRKYRHRDLQRMRDTLFDRAGLRR